MTVNPKAFQRARQPEQKEARRRSILVAAEALLAERDQLDFSLNEIAERSGLSKPNVYRYFESREAILLQLMCDDLREAVEATERRLGRLSGSGRRHQVARALATVYSERPRLCRFLGALWTVLEYNASEQTVAAAKTEILALSERAGRAIQAALPGTSQADAVWVAGMIALLAAGLWSAAHPAPAAAHVLARPEFAPLRVDMDRDFTRAIETLLLGLTCKAALGSRDLVRSTKRSRRGAGDP